MNNRHDWNSWDQYLAVHDSYIRSFMNAGFLLIDELTLTPSTASAYWKGALYCQCDLRIEVTKHQEIKRRARGVPMVRTVEYSYHVRRVIDGETTNLFRYDNVHKHEGHADHHHLHRYDSDGTDIKPTWHIGEANWPTLSDVIEKARLVSERLQSGIPPYEATNILP